jgi:hypothetical protein
MKHLQWLNSLYQASLSKSKIYVQNKSTSFGLITKCSIHEMCITIYSVTLFSPIYDIYSICWITLDLAKNNTKNGPHCTTEQLVLETLWIGDREEKERIVMNISCMEHMAIRPKLVDWIKKEIAYFAIFGASPEVLLAQPCCTSLALLPLISLHIFSLLAAA